MNAALQTSAGVGLAVLGVALLLVNILWPSSGGSRGSSPRREGLSERLKGAFGPKAVALGLGGLAAGVLLSALTGWMPFLVLLPVIAVAVPRLFSDAEEKHTTQMLVDLESWTRSLSGLIQTGRNLSTVLNISHTSASGGMAEPMRRFVARTSGGWSTEKALRALATDLNDSTADLVVMNLIAAARATGDGLRDALDGLAALVADEVQTRRKISAERSKPRFNARIILYITAAMMLAVPFVPFLSEGYKTPLGQLAFMAIALVIGAIVVRMQRIVRVVHPPRILEEATA